MDTNNTALAISSDIVGQIMIPADFSALDGLITKLGDRSTQLSADEKKSASEIVDAWNESVTQRIQENAARAADVLNFLDGKNMYGNVVDDVVEMFHSVIGDTPAYKAYTDALQKYNDVGNDQPLSAPATGDMTVAEADQVALANHAAQLEYNRKVKDAEYQYYKAVKAYIAEINALPDTKTVRANLTNYRRKATRMANECQDKATRAKLNITISDPATRDLLREMMDFAKKI